MDSEDDVVMPTPEKYEVIAQAYNEYFHQRMVELLGKGWHGQ